MIQNFLFQSKLYKIEIIQKYCKRTINWNKHESKASSERQNQYLDFLIDLSFQGGNILLVLSFKIEKDRKVHAETLVHKSNFKTFIKCCW